MKSKGLGQQQFQILALEVADQAVIFADDGGGQIALGALQLQNFLFDSIARDQAIGEDLVHLADAVGAVDGLGFDGGIPPGVEQKDVLGGGQVEAQSSSLQADEEQGASRVVLEALDALLAIA